MTTPNSAWSFQKGDVVYFVHLHLNTVKRLKKEGEFWSYSVTGKFRPMIILRELPSDRGCRWFRVIPLTTKGLLEEGKPKEAVVHIGLLPGENLPSYFEKGDVPRLPEYMIQKVAGHPRMKAPLEKHQMDHIEKLAGHFAMRYQ